MRLQLISCVCLATFGLAAPASAALSPLPPGRAVGDLIAYSASFRLQGTNGYQIQFGGFSERLDGRGEIYVGITRKRQAGAAYYSAPGIVSESFMKADLGPFG